MNHISCGRRYRYVCLHLILYSVKTGIDIRECTYRMEYTVPYGMYIQRVSESVKDYTFTRVLEELCANAFDVKAEPAFKVARHNSNDYLLSYTLGTNIQELGNYFGLGTIRKKSSSQMGQHNCCALKSICWLMPQRVIVLSCNESGESVSLTFRVSDYFASLNRCKTYNDASVSLSEYMITKEGPEVVSEIQPIVGCIKDRTMRDNVSAIRQKKPHCVVLFEFSERHRLYGQLDARIESSLPTLGFIYYAPLSYVKNIYIEYSTGKFAVFGRDNNLQDIFMNNTRMDTKVNVLQNDDDVQLQSQLTIYGKRDSWTNLTINNPNAELSGNPLHTTGTFTIKFTYLNAHEVSEQGHIHDCKGVLFTWNGRRSNSAYWNTVWGSKENGTHIRCELIAEDNDRVYTLLGSGNLCHAHPTVQTLLTMIMMNLAFVPTADAEKGKPVVSSALYTLLQCGPNFESNS